MAELESESTTDLIVLTCDSGSDKSFDFLGLAKVMEEVRKIIFDIWDRIVFHRQREVSESIQLISESLPVLQKISEMRASGALDPEAAELLSRKVKTGVQTFIEVGATIPELDSEPVYSARELMKPASKLLVAPDVSDDEDEVAVIEDGQNLTEKEREMLKRLQEKEAGHSDSTELGDLE